MFDIILEMMKSVMLNYRIPNFILKDMIVLFQSIIFLVNLYQLITKF